MRKEQIKQLDLYLSQHKGLLSEAEERRYIDLVVEGYDAPDAEDGQEEEPLPLELLRLNKKLQLLVRDSSTEVNAFIIGGRRDWINKHDRSNQRNAIDALALAQEPTVSFKGITLPIEQASMALVAIEKYAALCAERTEAHAAAIDDLQTAEEVEAYDITAGYPRIPNFDENEEE